MENSRRCEIYSQVIDEAQKRRADDFTFAKKKIPKNKKVPLRERKRHTTRHAASTRCAAVSQGEGVGYPP